MDRSKSVVTPQRFASGMTFDQDVRHVATPENLEREGSGGVARRDWSGYLRIVPRDGQRFSDSHRPSLAEAPDSNADIMAEFLNHKNGQTWQSIPVVVFYTRDLEYLCHYTEFPGMYHTDRLTEHRRAPRAGETKDETLARVQREFLALQESSFFQIWKAAAIDEMLSMLHERLVVGSLE